MRKTIGSGVHSRSSKRLLGLSVPLLFAVGSAACGSDTEPALESSQHALRGVKYDGATLVQGLFFGIGPVAEQLPQLWKKRVQPKLSPAASADAFRAFVAALDLSPEEEAAAQRAEKLLASGAGESGGSAEKVAAVLIRRIQARDASSLDRFAEGVQSGDPNRVSDAIKRITREFRAVTQFDHPLDTHSGAWLNMDIAINVQAVINVNVAVNVDHAYNLTQWWSLEQNPATDLRNEMMIAEITQQLAV